MADLSSDQVSPVIYQYEAAAALDVSSDTVYGMSLRGKLPPLFLHYGRLCFDRNAFYEALENLSKQDKQNLLKLY